MIGSALGGLLVAILGLLLAGLSGAVGVPVPGFPDAGRHAEESPSPEPQDAVVPQPASLLEQAAVSGAAVATTDPANRRVPTHTPTHPPRPSKT